MKTLSRDVTFRAGTPGDAAACGTICHDAFAQLARRHGFEPDFPSREAAHDFVAPLFERPDVYSVVAEKGGAVVGSNFLWRSPPVAGVGPITVDASVQDGSIGRALMEDVIARAEVEGIPAVRLVQAAYHCRSMSLYAKLGFDVREPLVCVQGAPVQTPVPGREVRAATLDDIPACDALCWRVHGHDRGHELRQAVDAGTATVVTRDARVTGYATSVGFLGHAVAETQEDLCALIGTAKSFDGPGFLLPTRQSEVFRWCLASGLRVIQPMTLMTRGLYNEPRGAWLPSVLF